MPNLLNNKQQELIDKLISNNLLTKEKFVEIDAAARVAGVAFNDMILEQGVVDPEQLAKIISEVYAISYVYMIDKDLSNDVLNIIPIEVAENFKIFCFDSLIDDNGQHLSIAMVDPSDFKAMEAVNFLARKENYLIKYFVVSRPSFDYAFKQYRTLNNEVMTALKDKSAKEDKEKKKQVEDNKKGTEGVITSAPVAKIVNVIIRHAIDGKASDIHIEPVQNECRIRYRIDGVLITSLSLPKNVHDSIVSRIKVLANLKLDETRVPQDGRFRIKIDHHDYDFRVSCLPLVEEEKVVMRILNTSSTAPTLKELGFWGIGLEVIEKNIKDTSGMFLVTGPTGSGKSTTIFSILNMLNDDKTNISTLEDPVEYYVKGINQSQIRPEIGFGFSSGLRTLLRQDPNIIMVGEIRDNETAELAIHAALTGHFILSTLHTNSAIGAVPRLFDMNVEPFLLVSTINTIVAQRLCRKICMSCKAEEKIPEVLLGTILEIIKKIPDYVINMAIPDFDINKIIFYKGKGCSHCGNTGYSGRVAVCEVMDVNEKIKDAILNNKRFTEEDVISSQKFTTMTQDGYVKVLQGITTVDEMVRILQN